MPQAPTSRPKPPPPGEEEAGTELRLGEFEGVETLSLSEAWLVINALMAKRRNDRKNVNETECVFFKPPERSTEDVRGSTWIGRG